MDYNLIKNQVKNSLIGFKGHIYGFIAIAMGIQFVINLIIGLILPKDTILGAVVSIIAQGIILPSVIGLVQCAMKARVKGTYRYVMPNFGQFIASVGIMAINTVTNSL